MSIPARPAPPSTDADGAAGGQDVDLEALLDHVVRELFSLAFGVAGALREVEGPVADRLSTVLEDADRLIRTVRAAAPALGAEAGRDERVRGVGRSLSQAPREPPGDGDLLL